MTRGELRLEVQSRINKNQARIDEVIILGKKAKETHEHEFNGELIEKMAYYVEEEERCKLINVLFSDYLNKIIDLEGLKNFAKDEIKISQEKIDYYLNKENSGFVLKRDEVEDSDKYQRINTIRKSYLINLEWLIREHKLCA